MKLYELPRNTKFLFQGEEYSLHHIDGMYSYCSDKYGNVVHFAAFTEIELTE